MTETAEQNGPERSLPGLGYLKSLVKTHRVTLALAPLSEGKQKRRSGFRALHPRSEAENRL